MDETQTPAVITTLASALADYETNRAYFDIKGTAKSSTLTRKALQEIIRLARTERKTVQELRKVKAAEKKALKAVTA